MDEQACRVCGCTQNTACVDEEHGPCWWLEEDLCSHCAQYIQAAEAADLNDLVTIAAHAEWLKARGNVEEEAQQRLRRIERQIEWIMIPGHVGHEIHVAVVGRVEIFENRPTTMYRHALGERLGPCTETIDEAQADVVAEVVSGIYTKKVTELDDARARAQAEGWVVYAFSTPEQQSPAVAKIIADAGMKWLSMSFEDGGDSRDLLVILIDGPVPDELPEGILREKPCRK